jgi:hypothetical protein
MLGCWKRKYIRFKSGETDTSTIVIWLQTLSSMVDIRIPERILDFSKGDSLEEYTVEQLCELATQDCSTAITRLDESTTPYPTASWESNDDDAYIQMVVNFPEDGWFDWKEDGSCMMEWAPSGAYEEDWRLLANSRSHITEFRRINNGKNEFVFLAGDHVVYVRSRALEIKELRPIEVIAKEYLDNKDYLIALVDVEFSYAYRKEAGDEFEIKHSTLPFREGQNLKLDFLLESKADENECVNLDTGDT